MIFRQIETHYHLMMLSICDLGTFVFNFLVRLHPSLKGKKLEKLLEDWRVPISKSAFPTVIEAFLKFLEYQNLSSASCKRIFLLQSSIILLLFKSHLSFFSSGYQNMQSWKSNFWTRQILFIDHCQKLWLVAWKLQKSATMRECLALRFKRS